MLNEQLEVRNYLDGINLNHHNPYRMCYMLAAYYRDEGLDCMEIREKIFEFGSKYSVFFEFSVNSVINRVFNDNVPLLGDMKVYISENDINEIRRRFDNKNTRLLALALLAYGKIHANKIGECYVSMSAIANWLGMNYGNLLSRHLKELINFRYITKIDQQTRRAKTYRSPMTRIRFNVPFNNVGETLVEDNNIVAIFNRYF